MKLPFKKRSWAKIWKSDYLTGFVVRRAVIGFAIALGLINLPDFVRYMKIEMM